MPASILCVMGRLRRPYLPGGIFHLTARTIRRELWFTPRLRGVAFRVIAEVAPRSDARLLAVAIMSNHLHLLVRQGDRPLSALMQPLLMRLALAVHTVHDLEGPVFWRHYASQPCLHPEHARNAIVYTHLNPVRAGLCEVPEAYPWTSHGLYAGESGEPGAGEASVLDHLRPVLDSALGLDLFAARPTRRLDQLRADYRRFVEWRLEADRLVIAGDGAADSSRLPPPPTPPAPWGPSTWGSPRDPLFRSVGRAGAVRPGESPDPNRPDMAAAARAVLEATLPGATLDGIRGRGGGMPRVEARRAIIRRLHLLGYRNGQIAAFLNLSDSTISEVIRTPRRPA